MGKSGFSLIELMIVVALIGILLGAATLAFNDYVARANIEKQTKTLYSDIINARSESMFRRAGRYTTITSNLFNIYSSNSLMGQPVKTTYLKSAIQSNDSTIRFNERGLLVDAAGALLDHSVFICVAAANSAALDSIIIGTVNVQMGKNNGACDQAGVTPK